MFDAAKHMQRAECFLGERMRLMVTMRPLTLIVCTRTDTARAAVATHCSGSLQEELGYHQSTGYDILFECWAVADRLNLHAIAADCEWALARLWKSESVYTRAALDLSPGALHRIARSLCTGTEAARKVLDRAQARARKGYNSHLHCPDLDEASKCLDAIASAQTMMGWRMSKEG